MAAKYMLEAQRGCQIFPPGPGWSLIVHVQNPTPVKCDETEPECMRYIKSHVHTVYARDPVFIHHSENQSMACVQWPRQSLAGI